MSPIIMRKQYGNAVLKTDIDNHGNSIRKYQYKATLFHELTAVDYRVFTFVIKIAPTFIIKIAPTLAKIVCGSFQ